MGGQQSQGAPGLAGRAGRRPKGERPAPGDAESGRLPQPGPRERGPAARRPAPAPACGAAVSLPGDISTPRPHSQPRPSPPPARTELPRGVRRVGSLPPRGRPLPLCPQTHPCPPAASPQSHPALPAAPRLPSKEAAPAPRGALTLGARGPGPGRTHNPGPGTSQATAPTHWPARRPPGCGGRCEHGTRSAPTQPRGRWPPLTDVTQSGPAAAQRDWRSGSSVLPPCAPARDSHPSLTPGPTHGAHLHRRLRALVLDSSLEAASHPKMRLCPLRPSPMPSGPSQPWGRPGSHTSSSSSVPLTPSPARSATGPLAAEGPRLSPAGPPPGPSPPAAHWAPLFGAAALRPGPASEPHPASHFWPFSPSWTTAPHPRPKLAGELLLTPQVPTANLLLTPGPQPTPRREGALGARQAPPCRGCPGLSTQPCPTRPGLGSAPATGTQGSGQRQGA